ncbi:MAG: hypothetical protein ACXABO_12740 [Promethearchaeota archaeon]
MSTEENNEHRLVTCCVMNCQKEVPIEKAIKIKDNYFCRICGVVYYRSNLNI